MLQQEPRAGRRTLASANMGRAPLWMVTALTLALGWSAAEARQAGPPEEFEWEAAAVEARALAFPESFFDSVNATKGVAPLVGARRQPQRSFLRGERLVFSVSWGPWKAGTGVVTAVADTLSGRVTLTVEGMTNNFVGSFYRVRDLLQCSMDAQGLYPYYFAEHLREGKYKADRWVIYDHQREKVFTHSSKCKEAEAPRFSHSILTLLYALRSMDLRDSTEFTLNCFIQKLYYEVRFRCRDRETLRTDLGTFDCIVVEPVLVGKGRVFTDKDKLRIWLTNDECALPVLIRSKIAVGSISVKLVNYSMVAASDSTCMPVEGARR